MSSFITVDNDTWKYLSDNVKATFDPYAIRNTDIAPPYIKVKCEEAEKLRLTIKLNNEDGIPTEFVIPGRSLVQPNVGHFKVV
jgi:hypothetical protein